MDAALRILDANLNRAREGLRTAEEYARLALDDAQGRALLAGARGLIREFVESNPTLAARLLEARDIACDVGLDRESAAPRAGLEDTARAAFKRAQEALRVIEETARLVVPGSAVLAARARYMAYEAEARVLMAGPRLKTLRESPVMVVFTRALCRGSWRVALEALIGAGARLFQLREKEAEAGELIRHAAEFRALCQGVVLVNDRADVARAANADGVHVGQRDLPPDSARKAAGHGRLVGVSTHNAAEAADAERAGADYLGLGAMFPTDSKKVESFAGPEVVRQVLAEAKLPLFCIGGVAPGNVARLRELGAKHAAAGASVLGAARPSDAFRALVDGLAG